MTPIGQLQEELRRARRRGWHLVGGRVLPELPRGAQSLGEEMAADVVLARIDREERAPYSRPILTRSELGRDFWIADDSGRALVRVGNAGHLHPDVELHLDAPFVEHQEEPDADEVARATYLRVVRAGDEVYVWGRPIPGLANETGYRDLAPTVEFSTGAVIHIYDAPAFRQLAAWRALPWYRKLSVLLRNR